MFATRNNRTNVIQLLMQKGTDVNKWEYWGDTPVHHAAIYNSAEAIEILVEHDALINNTNNGGEKSIETIREYESEAAVYMPEQL